MKIILDTNTLLVSVSPYSPYFPIYKALIDKEFDLLVTTEILLEYEEIISNKMGNDVARDILEFLSNASNVTKINKTYFWLLIERDPDDDKFSDAAVTGNADYLVSDDAHFRVLKQIAFPKIKLLTTKEFLNLILEK